MELNTWQRWTWEEIFSALSRDGEPGGCFEVPRDQVAHPLSYAAEPNSDPLGEFHFKLTAEDGRSLCIREEADKFVAFLETPLRMRKSSLALAWPGEPRRVLLEAAAGLVMVLGGLVAWWQFANV